MAVFNNFNPFVADVHHGVHDFSVDQLVIALSDVAPLATNGALIDITQIAYTNLSGVTPRNITTTSSSQSSGVYSLVLEDLVLTASGGAVGPFRYVVIYNDAPANDPLLGWSDYGSSITMNDGETFTIDFNVSGLFTSS